jgi:hypothetical protein
MVHRVVKRRKAFKRQGSQVQSLYRPPSNQFAFAHLRAFFRRARNIVRTNWGHSRVRPRFTPHTQRTENCIGCYNHCLNPASQQGARPEPTPVWRHPTSARSLLISFKLPLSIRADPGAPPPLDSVTQLADLAGLRCLFLRPAPAI